MKSCRRKKSLNGSTKKKCPYCEQSFSNHDDFKNHTENLEAFLKIYCNNCENFILAGESSLHLEITSSCSLCKKKLDDELLSHKCFHEDYAQDLARNLKTGCVICNKIYFSAEDVNYHVKIWHNSDSTYFCQCCNLTFKKEKMYTAHINFKHKKSKKKKKIKQSKENSIKSDKKKCSQCPLLFDNKKDYLAHKRRAHEIFLCYICGKKMHINFMRTHIDMHDNYKRFKCKFCDKRFRLPGTVRNHQMIHSNEANYQCQMCGKGFKKAYNLKVHMRIHSPVKPFECVICRKTFTTKQSRDNHLKTHK